MTANPPEIKLCVTCRHLVSGACEHPSNMKVSFVDGVTQTYNSATFVREFDKRPSDGVELCGPTGRFHERAPDPNGYPEVMIRKDQEKLHVGCSEQDLDIACRKLQAGS